MNFGPYYSYFPPQYYPIYMMSQSPAVENPDPPVSPQHEENIEPAQDEAVENVGRNGSPEKRRKKAKKNRALGNEEIFCEQKDTRNHFSYSFKIFLRYIRVQTTELDSIKKIF